MTRPPVPLKRSGLGRKIWFPFKDSPGITRRRKLVCGVHCIDVAIHLVPKREPSLVGKIGLWATCGTAGAVAFTAPRGGGGQPGLQLFTCYY